MEADHRQVPARIVLYKKLFVSFGYRTVVAKMAGFLPLIMANVDLRDKILVA
jgi:hypothetical protein